MTSILFEAAIQQPDNDASNSQLYKLVSARDFSGSNLHLVAERYLETFCNTNLSIVRRRWVGIALAGMLEKPKVTAHIKGSTQLLHNLGAIILSSTEQEQAKIVTGIIIRQALEQGIDYCNFWSSEKVRHSAPNFPLEAGAKWMNEFQTFLDALSDPALTRPTNEPSITYFVSLFTSDKFRWRESASVFPIALIEAGVLTVIAPDEHLKECQFVEVPIEHIVSTRSEPSALHNSQEQHMEHEPWDLVMTLKSSPWSYRLNSAQRIATEMSLMFKHCGDALEWKSCIESHKRVHMHYSETSRNMPIDVSSPSVRSSTARRSLRSSSQPRWTERIATKKPRMKSSDLGSLQPRIQTPRADLQPQHQSTTLRRTTHSKGKLPRITQAAKQKIFEKLNAESDAESEDLDIAIENARNNVSDTSSVTSSPRKRSQGPNAVPSKKAVKSKSKARVSHTKHMADDDEEFMPTQTRTKKKTSTKRKAALDTTAESKSRKKPRNDVKSRTTNSEQQDQTHLLAKPLRSPHSVTSPQNTLVEGLLGAKRAADLSGLAFKKPTLPARVVQTPSTPTKPNRTPAKAASRPKTPMEARRRSGGHILQYMASSPLVADDAEDSNEWFDGFVETAILSSNSKPTPASPTADSTAISGHADCNDVASEKKTGDWQTAKSDPFSRRSVGKMATSFIRRLTGEESTNADVGPDIGISKHAPFTVAGSSKSEAYTTVSRDDETTPALLRNKVAAKNEVIESNLDSYQQVVDSIQPASALQISAKMTQQAMEYAQHTIEETKQLVDDTPVEETPDEDNVNFEDITLVGGNGYYQQVVNELNVSPIKFCSSPPRPGSSGSHSSTSATPEPLTDPPVPSSEADELQWEASLQAHQRDLNKLLMRTLKRVMRHIVDSETSVTDIAEMYAQDGDHVLSALIQRHDTDHTHIFQDMENMKAGLRKELESAAKQMAKDRRRLSTIS
ncbi:hypothetical protein ACET3X_008278 [Alternaria dauci]|uniref:Uncharacterized protein n=1 Tax=Alternaria dauci TaxID=48095 RepID=A0ABR3UCF8_9PLEO